MIHFLDMARIHTDLHFIPADLTPAALSLLIKHGFIKRSERDVRFCDISSRKRQYPVNGTFIEVKSIY